MVKVTFAAAMFVASGAAVGAPSGWLTVGESAFVHLKQQGYRVTIRANRPPAPKGDGEPVYLLEVNARDVPAMAGLLHQKLRHCGGFMYHATEAEARSVLEGTAATPPRIRPDYEVAQQAVVVPLLAQMEEKRIADTIARLSAFTNRYYTSDTGKAASDWLRGAWQELASGNTAIAVAQHAHKGYGQQSVIATIAGTDKAAEVLVLGAHLDSINTGLSPRSARAPGADDDASGVASLTEVLRVLASTGYQPRRTIKLIAYAAEEVGLRGSQDIARAFKNSKVDVVGVLQLDMTNYKGSSKDIYLITDYTDGAQNAFIGKLAAAYLPTIQVGSDKCGYACSDHAAWSAQGFATSMPFESMLRDDNPHIHSKNDSYANSGEQSAHALKFARLAAAYAVEIGSGKR